jgi:hypothetical protein
MSNTVVDELYGSKYLHSNDLNGQRHTLVIDGFSTENFRDGSKKLAIKFRGAKKALVLNKTNVTRLTGAYGVNPHSWVGQSVEVYAEWVDFSGESVLGLRLQPVRKPTLVSAAAPLAASAPAIEVLPPQNTARPDPDDSVPF